MSENKMLSLYDYLGHAAGRELGEQVAKYAKIRKAKCNTRYVSNPVYTGPVMMYEREFLNEYFQVKQIFEEDYTEINTQLVEDGFKTQEQENQNRIF
jgi:hypothetical protein